MELTEIGYFSKTQGVKGQLLLKLSRDISTDELRALFVETGGNKAPFFISGLAELNHGLMVSLEEIDTLEKARPLIGKKVLVEARFVEEDEAETDWVGFELVDEQHGSLGLIRSVTDNGAQTLVALEYQGREVILPLVEDFIMSVDEGKRVIHFRAPDGLIDIYLNSEE